MNSETQPVHLSTKDGYDQWSEIYDGDGNPLILLEEPHVTKLLGSFRDRVILDAGCGTGRHTIPLADAGACVTGIDFSKGMLEKARAKSGAHLARFIEHDLSMPFPFPAQTFDRVICCLVLDHVSNLGFFFSELARVCRRDGFIVISIMHPAMMLKGIQARFHDAVTGAEVRPASAPNQISDYIMAAVEAGLLIEHCSEHAVDESLAQRAPRARKYLGWPMLLMMKMRPVAP